MKTLLLKSDELMTEEERETVSQSMVIHTRNRRRHTKLQKIPNWTTTNFGSRQINRQYLRCILCSERAIGISESASKVLTVL